MDEYGEGKNTKKALYILTIAISIVIGIILGIWQINPPTLPREGSIESLVYQRMMTNIQRLAVEPHPSGSIEIEFVRSELISEIEDMGLIPIIQKVEYTVLDFLDITARIRGYSTREEMWEDNRERININYPDIQNLEELFRIQNPDLAEGLLLQNILVKLDAPGTEQGIMFVAHYDSVPEGPGAADAMVAVCAMLEAMRMYSHNESLTNDIYFLFTDGEERGLLGAWAFVEEFNELKDKIDMVINLEARGNRGGLILFETSPQAYPLINTVVNSDAKIIGFSWAVEIYRMMPNDTDLTAFLSKGYNGINFAVIGGVEHYHQPTDTFENLNQKSAWHYLQTTLAITDFAVNNSMCALNQAPSEAVFFPFIPGNLVLMNIIVSQILYALICVLVVFYFAFIIKNKTIRISISTIFIGLLLVLSFVSSVIFATGAYLFYIPLLCVTATASLKGWKTAYITALNLTSIIALMLWVPVVYLLWVSLVQPMLL